MEKMDLINQKILCELDLNCRIPLSQLAKKLRVSRNVVAYRIKCLEEKGIITNYICSINLGLLGYKTYKIYLKVRDTREEKEFIAWILDCQQVIHCLKIEGFYDYSLAVAVCSIKELDELLMTLKQHFKEFIKDYTVSLVVYTSIFKLHKLLLGKKMELPKIEKYSGEGKEVIIDEKDKVILKQLSQHGNLSLIKLSDRTKLSLDVVKHRMKKVSNSIVLSYRGMFDLNKLGYYHYVVMLRIRQAAKQDIEKLVSWCRLRRNVLYCSKRIGDFDFEINAAIRDIDELNGLLAGLREEFSEVIDSHETMLISKLLKLNYVPF